MTPLRLALTVILLLSGIIMSGAEPLTVRYDDRDGLSSKTVGGGVCDGHGLLWFATWNGLNCYDGYDFRWIKIQPGDGASIGTNHIRDIMLSPEGNIVCHTDCGIHEFNLSLYRFCDIPPQRADSLKGRMGRRWHGVTDAQGNLWTADRTGLYKTYTPHHPARLLEGTGNGHPRSFLVDRDGYLWVGLRNSREIKVYDSSLKPYKTIPLPTAPYCIFQTRGGDIWVGGKPGALFRLGGESITGDAVYDIKEDRFGRLWIATFGAGVRCCADPKASVPVLSPTIGERRKVKKLIITPSDNLVAATTDGLLIGHIDGRDCTATQLREVRRDPHDDSSLCSDATLSLAQDRQGNIYVGTESSGVDMISEESLFSGHPVFHHLNRRSSVLPSDVCNALSLVADTLLMVVGNDNVMAYNPHSGQTANLGMAFWADSCRFAETTPVTLPDGTRVLGAEEGVFLATPRSIDTHDYVPPLVFTTLAVNGGAEEFCLVPLSEITLPASQRNVTIGFAAIDYIDNRGILYRTRVDGSTWTAAGHTRSLTLFNMTPGTHVVEVQSTDRYGRWVDNTRQLSVTVEPYWHETWWALALFVLLGAAVVAGAVCAWLYVRKERRQRAELLEKYMALIRERGPEPSAGEESRPARPDVQQALSPGQKPEDTAFLNRVRRYIEANIANPEANIDDMAAASASSRSTLNRHLRSQLGVSGTQLLIEARMQRARQLLRGDAAAGHSIADVAMMCGYSDTQYFQRVFKKHHGISPAQYRAEDGV